MNSKTVKDYDRIIEELDKEIESEKNEQPKIKITNTKKIPKSEKSKKCVPKTSKFQELKTMETISSPTCSMIESRVVFKKKLKSTKNANCVKKLLESCKYELELMWAKNKALESHNSQLVNQLKNQEQTNRQNKMLLKEVNTLQKEKERLRGIISKFKKDLRDESLKSRKNSQANLKASILSTKRNRPIDNQRRSVSLKTNTTRVSIGNKRQSAVNKDMKTTELQGQNLLNTLDALLLNFD